MLDDFSNHPTSITEARSCRSGAASEWTPRDVLIDLLRQIDSGEFKPDALVVAYREPLDDGRTRTRYRNATSDIHTALGMLDLIRYFLIDDGIGE